MRHIHGLCTLLSLLVFESAQASPSERTRVLTIEADEWCPINCEASASQQGIGIDLAKKIFEPLGYRINYVIVPWTQALQDVHNGKADAVVGASAQDDAGLKYPSSPIVRISDDFYVLNGNPWRYQGAHTLKDKKLAVIAGYGYGDVITQFIKENSRRSGMITQSSGADALVKNITALKANKVDIIIESKVVMDYTLQKKSDQQIKWAGGVDQGPVYLAFNPTNPLSATLASQFDAGISKLRASGELDRMYRTYSLKP